MPESMSKKQIFLFLVLFFFFLPFGSSEQTKYVASAGRLQLPATTARTESATPTSAYDALFQRVAGDDLDWRLISAIAYSESRYIPDLVSPHGATGLMQVMPATARAFDVPAERLTDPETNVRVAVRLIREIDRSLRFSAGTSADDRRRIMLACYNGGIGHVLDARRLATKHGANPDDWDDVAHYLTLMSQPEYATDEVVKYGRFRGATETLKFVNHVSGKYNTYCARN
jgi:membrane-bound lytic murein transglycosylase F